MRPYRWAAVLALVGLGACRELGERTEARIGRESDAFEDQVSILLVKYEQFEAQGLADSVAALFTDNAHVAFPRRPALYGRQAVRDYLAAFYASGKPSLNLRSEDAVANGPVGVEHGSYVFQFASGPEADTGLAALFPDSGNYLAHWHREGGRWRIAELVMGSMSPAR